MLFGIKELIIQKPKKLRRKRPRTFEAPDAEPETLNGTDILVEAAGLEPETVHDMDIPVDAAGIEPETVHTLVVPRGVSAAEFYTGFRTRPRAASI